MRRKIQVLAAVLTGSAVLAGAAGAASSPAVVTGGTSSRTNTSAVLDGTVNPNGSSTTYYFQWGLTTGYGATSKPASAGNGTTTVAVKTTAAGLTPGTTYHYRLGRDQPVRHQRRARSDVQDDRPPAAGRRDRTRDRPRQQRRESDRRRLSLGREHHLVVQLGHHDQLRRADDAPGR